LEEIARLLLISYPGFNFTPQRFIATARFIEKSCALIADSLER
jgi:hypothetical protein